MWTTLEPHQETPGRGPWTKLSKAHATRKSLIFQEMCLFTAER